MAATDKGTTVEDLSNVHRTMGGADDVHPRVVLVNGTFNCLNGLLRLQQVNLETTADSVSDMHLGMSTMHTSA